MYNMPPPYSTRNNYSKSKNLYNNDIYNQTKIRNSNTSTVKKDFNFTQNQDFLKNKTGAIKEDKPYNDDVLFEIFGLKIYFDDVLILCILLFLYQEGIQDQYLFIALILLLLS